MSIEEKAKQTVLKGTKEEIDKRLGKVDTLPIIQSTSQEDSDKATKENKNSYEVEIETLKRQLDSSKNQQSLLSKKLNNQQQNFDKTTEENKNNYEVSLAELNLKINNYEEALLKIGRNNLKLLADIDDSSADQDLKDKIFSIIQDRCQSFSQDDDCITGTVMKIKGNNDIGEQVQFCCKFENFWDPIIGLNNGLLDIYG